MKKLFSVIDSTTGKTATEVFYENKMLAKAERTKLNGTDAEKEGKFRFVVGLGPDHRRYQPTK